MDRGSQDGRPTGHAFSILVAEMGVLSVDPLTGDYTRLDWPAEEPVDWQRVCR